MTSKQHSELFTLVRNAILAKSQSVAAREEQLSALGSIEEQLEAVQRENEEMRMVLDAAGWKQAAPGNWERSVFGVSSPASEPKED